MDIASVLAAGYANDNRRITNDYKLHTSLARVSFLKSGHCTTIGRGVKDFCQDCAGRYEDMGGVI